MRWSPPIPLWCWHHGWVLAVCLGWVRKRAVQTRLLWTLLCAALVIWEIGILFAAREDLFQHITFTVAYFSDFLFFCYGVPVLLAISSPTEGEKVSLFFWLDGIQVLMTAFLTYVTIFAAAPFTHRAVPPLSVGLLLITYNVENLALAMAATLRLQAYPHDGEKRRFYQVLCGFLWVYALCVSLYNHLTVMLDEHTGLYDLLEELPFVFLALAIVFLFTQHKEEEPLERKPLAVFIDNASPIFFTLALLGLGAALVRQHFYIGMSGIVLALAVYGIRATILQSRYMQIQQELQAAKDLMEEMSLTDSLTGVANRRCFDHTLDVEWRRAVRRRSPLSLLMIDVDHFKNVNDKYGHRCGDEYLIQIAQSLQSALPRSADLLARYGGEEFAAILSATDNRGANIVACRMQEVVRALNLDNETQAGPCLTISVGIASYEFPHDGSIVTFVEDADGALYRAKRLGRNRVEHASA
jgi:diguanylate cyclase (GGDEF)-like protein